MTNDKKNKPAKYSLAEEVYVNSNKCDGVCEKSLCSDQSITVGKVREDLRNVIETMGPNSLPTDNDADNETSTYTTSGYSVVQIQEVSTNDEINDSLLEDSLRTVYNVSEVPEYPIYQTAETAVQTKTPDYSCVNINHGINPYICPHIINASHNFCQNNDSKLPKYTSYDRASRFANWLGFRNKKEPCRNCEKKCDLYKINIEQTNEDQSPPRRLVFDLMDELPKAETKTIGTNTKRKILVNRRQQNPQQTNVKQVNAPNIKHLNKTITERVDIYYFDHGNAEYYCTTDSPPLIRMEHYADKTDQYTKKFWAEFFGTFHIGISFVVSFILQLFRFILQAIYRPLVIGFIQLASDYCFKPSLAVLFNGIIQPPMIFLYNLATSIRDICTPIADSFGYFIREISVMLKAVRLVQVDTGKTVKRVENEREKDGCM